MPNRDMHGGYERRNYNCLYTLDAQHNTVTSRSELMKLYQLNGFLRCDFCGERIWPDRRRRRSFASQLIILERA